MTMSDTLGDMLTRIRNGQSAGLETVGSPASKLRENVLAVLKKEGFIRNYNLEENNYQGVLHIGLKYGPNDEPVILGIKRISKPGLRVYVKAKEIPRVVNGLGIAILSTPRGVLADRTCRQANVGGEVLCYVW